MDDENVSNFMAITSADAEKAAGYLRLTDNNLEQAIQLFFDSPGLDLGGEPTGSQASAADHPATHNPIQIDSDEEMSDVEAAPASNPVQPNVEDDAAMARRLQEEMYGSGTPGEAEVRAPMQRTTETLVGPGASWGPGDLDDEVNAQLAARRRAAPGGRAGIFNQRTSQASVWDSSGGDSSERRRELERATGGASEHDSKSNMLAQMYRPPFELMYQQGWDNAREEGKEQEKWLLVNIQDPAIFDCQILNRDIWKNDDIKATVRENFIFMQFSKDDPRGQTYVNYYFQNKDSQDAYPHIAVVDPRTGEQVKVWSGPPTPHAVSFHAELHEFLDRYSLKANAKNPVAMRKPEGKKKDVGKMTEDEMLEMALQASLDNDKRNGPKDDDPDALTKGEGKGKARADEPVVDEEMTNGATDTPFAQISDVNSHTEPEGTDGVTRIKFTASGGQQVRKFKLTDPVRRIYEWIKAGGWEGKEGLDFDLVSMRKNLIDSLDMTIQDAGLRNGVVNVEFSE